MLTVELDRSVRAGGRVPPHVKRLVSDICRLYTLDGLVIAIGRDGAVAFNHESDSYWFLPGLRADLPYAVSVSPSGESRAIGAVRRVLGFRPPAGRTVYRAPDDGYYHPVLGFAPVRTLYGSPVALLHRGILPEPLAESLAERAVVLSDPWYPMVSGSSLMEDDNRLWYRFEHDGMELVVPNPSGAKPFAYLYDAVLRMNDPRILLGYGAESEQRFQQLFEPYLPQWRLGLARSSVRDRFLNRLWRSPQAPELLRSGKIGRDMQLIVCYDRLDGRDGSLVWRVDQPVLRWRGEVPVRKLLTRYDLVLLHDSINHSQVYSDWLLRLPGSRIWVAPSELDLRHIPNRPDGGVLRFDRETELVRIRTSILFLEHDGWFLMYLPHMFVRWLEGAWLGRKLKPMECGQGWHQT